jgi:hypothetical protein
VQLFGAAHEPRLWQPGGGRFLPSHGFIVVSLCDIPDGLNTDELEQYLREHGAELRLGPATDSGAK